MTQSSEHEIENDDFEPDDLEGEGSEDLDIEDEDEPKEDERIHVEVRRAIEDHLERTRLRKDLDYLYDEDFTHEDEEDNH